MEPNLRELFNEALKWGLHDDNCKSFDAKWHNYEEQDHLCNCWMKRVKDVLNNSKIAIVPTIKDYQHQQCSCKHPSSDHVNSGKGLCVANSCNCMKFKL